MTGKIIRWGLALFAAVLVALGGLGILLQPYSFRGSLIDPPVLATDFTLVDQHNQPFRLSEQRGNVVVMAFGYTYCPDVCPATLAEFKQIRRLLGRQADQVRFVFITVDPERDTPARLGEYMQAFDSSFLGLSGDMAELERAWQGFGVYHEKQFLDSAAGYLVDHTARIYVVDVHGNLRLTFSFGTVTQDMFEDIQYLAGERI